MTSPTERDRAKLVAIHEMLPRLREHLPKPLYSELCATIYLWPPEPLTEADIAHGQRVAQEIAVEDVMRERYPFGPSRLGTLGKAVHHIDGDPTNNDPSNLQIVDLNENTATKEQQP